MTKPGSNVSAVAALWAQGLPVRVIADRLGLSNDAVKRVAQKNRDLCPERKAARGPGQPAAVVERASEMWRTGLSAGDIAHSLGITRNTVIGLTARKRELFPRRDVAARGEAGPAPVRPGAIPRTTIRGVSLPAMSWDRREPERASPSA